ncbi:MAG: GNAT family N-acetyltransferase [Microbacterium sp.]|uniref:GNAT family N-acetyltransferase n=1 Tax=Microbacterium sp. TaxID=51671 RepID=UPI003F9E58AF
MAEPTVDGYSLAPVTPALQGQLAQRVNDPETWKPYNWFGYEYGGTPGGSFQGIPFGEGGMLAILDESAAFVGHVQWVPGFWYGGANRNRAWNFGLIVFPEYQRTRATRAALLLLFDYLFTHTTANRIEATTPAAAAKRSQGIESTGLRREGLMRQAQWREGRWHDMTLLAILREDWEGQKREGRSPHNAP